MAAQKFIPEYVGHRAFDLLRGFVFASRWLAAGAATGLALLSVFAVYLCTPLLDPAAVIPLYIAASCLPIYALGSVQDGIARSYNSASVGLVPDLHHPPNSTARGDGLRDGVELRRIKMRQDLGERGFLQSLSQERFTHLRRADLAPARAR